MTSTSIDSWELLPVVGLSYGDLPYESIDALVPFGADARALGIATPDWGVTIAGAICAAATIDHAGPHLQVVYSEFPSGVAECRAGRIAPVESLTKTGPVQLALDDLVAGLVDVAPRRFRDDDLSERLFLELVVNAIGHRSFAPEFQDRPVRIDVYADQILIGSPGPLPSGVTLRDGVPAGRFSRNPHLMALLCRLGLAHQQGRGTAWSRRLAPELGYRIEWLADEGAVLVRLTVDPELLVRADSRVPGPERRRRAPQELVEARILEILQQCGMQSRSELQRDIEVSTSKMRAVLDSMVERGVILRTEGALRSPHQRYRLSKRRRG